MITIAQLYNYYLENSKISTDTRNITEGCIFFALKGENFNANGFAEEALKKGAKFCVIDEQQYAHLDGTLLVEDVLESLQNLARMYRQHLKIPVIGLTGSNGKTTSKELINAVLAQRFKTFATSGNLNNHIGVPLSILAIKSDVEIAVIEMGANHQKEIEFLSNIAQPTHGIITNVGLAHLDGFGGFEGVKKGKGELYTYLKETNGYTFINSDNSYLMDMSNKAGLNKIIYYGSGHGNAIKGSLKNSDPFIEIDWTNQETSSSVKTNLTGSYNFENILMAICIGDFFDLSPEEINNGLATYEPKNNRSQLTKTEKNTVICDFYNANPSSMSAALTNISVLTANKKIAILGDMFELGPESTVQHELIVKQATESGLDEVIFIGKDFFQFSKDYKGLFFQNPDAVATYLEENLKEGSLILLKGSRGMKLESLMEYL